MCITSKLNWYLYVVAGFDHYHSALSFFFKSEAETLWPGQLTLFTARSGVSNRSAKMPLSHSIQVILPVRGQLHLSTGVQKP